MTFDLNDLVALTIDLPDQGLARGAIGTIVHVFNKPNRAFEVEFCDELGHTRAQLSLRPEYLAAARAAGSTSNAA